METPRPPEQLKINFDTGNPFADRLRKGEFGLVIEYETPPATQPFKPALALGQALARRIRDLPAVTGMAVTDRSRTVDSHDPVEAAAPLAEASGKPLILHVSGKGSSVDRVRDLVARAGSCGIRNLLAVTGDRSDADPGLSAGGRRVPYPAGYLDSVRILDLVRSSGLSLLAGAVINPYKYNAADQYLQYHKAIRKLASGAQFLVAQYGWDMAKLQEVQWFLQMREVGHPIVARLLLLSLDDVRALQERITPGVSISRAFAAMLQREGSVNATQCLSAQLTRIGLQVAGCRLLGYSGVQLAGVRDVKTLEMILARVRETQAACRTYDDWLTAWKEFHGELQVAPVQAGYHTFSGLLTPGHAMYSPDVSLPTAQPGTDPSRGDKARCLSLSVLLSRHSPNPVRRATRSLLCRRCRDDLCRFEYCFYLCPEECPKELVFGPCGGSEPDGMCEFGHRRCFHHRVLSVAAWRQALDRMEDEIPRE